MLMNQNSNFTEITNSAIHRSRNNLLVTNYIASQFPEIFTNCSILHINHPLEDVYALNEIFRDLGAIVNFISVPYANKVASKVDYYNMYSLREKIEFQTYLNGKRIESITDVDLVRLLKSQINYTLENEILPNLGEQKLIVIQDGGYTNYLYDDSTNTNPFSKIPQLIGMVEQTQSGYKAFIEAQKVSPLDYPVITIARSKIKMQFESKFIAQRMFEELNNIFNKIGNFLRYRTFIIGGYGIIGRQLAYFLRNIDIEVIVYDIDPEILRLARKEGFYVTQSLSPECIEQSFCYFGCTGKSSFGINELYNFLHSGKKEYYLVSGSSKRTEFLPLIFFFERPNDDKEKSKLIDEYPFLKEINNISVNTNSSGLVYEFSYRNTLKKINLIAEGFPVNLFDKESESVPDRAIDPIQALLLLSAIRLKGAETKLDNQIYKVGAGSNKIDLDISEQEILDLWCKANEITIPGDNLFIHFSEHPFSQKLMNKD